MRRYVNRKDKEYFKSIMEDKGYEINDIDIRQILCMIDFWNKYVFYLKNEDTNKIKIVTLDRDLKEITMKYATEREDDYEGDEDDDEYPRNNRGNEFDEYPRNNRGEFEYLNVRSKKYNYGTKNEIIDIVSDIIKYDIDYDYWGEPTESLKDYLEWDDDFIESHPLIH